MEPTVALTDRFTPDLLKALSGGHLSCHVIVTGHPSEKTLEGTIIGATRNGRIMTVIVDGGDRSKMHITKEINLSGFRPLFSRRNEINIESASESITFTPPEQPAEL